MVVATVYTQELHLEYLLHVALVYGLIWFLNFKGFKSLSIYLILGIALWVYIHAVGIHATIAGVLLAFAIPIQSRIDEERFIRESQEALEVFAQHKDSVPMLNHHQVEALEQIAYGYDRVQNPLVKLEHRLHNLSAFVIMPLFAFSNAGVVIEFASVQEHLMIVLGVVFGLIVGKPLGIFGFTYLATKLNIIQKPDTLTWQEVFAVGFLGGIGFTMSIFITHLAFSNETIIDAVKLGVFVASFVSATIGVWMIMRLDKRKQK
jgi:NhaA family Na+:H+ antiporter